MKKQSILLLVIFTVLSGYAFAQTIEAPVKWKLGDTWKYKLDQRDLGGITGGDVYTTKGFQLKVLAVNPEGKPGYTVEWKYTSYTTFYTDTLEEECAVTFKKFLLQTPIQLKLNAKGKYVSWLNKADIKKKFTTFYAQEAKKNGSQMCIESANSMMALGGTFADYFEAHVPEIQVFFKAFGLLPAEADYKKDTTEVFQDYILDATKTITLPKSIEMKASAIAGDAVQVSLISRVSEPDYKKYFSQSTKAGWDKMNMTPDVRKSFDEQLEAFQPKSSESFKAVFDKKNGAVRKFDYVTEMWGMLKGGESNFYVFEQQ